MIITIITTLFLCGIDKILEYYNILGRYYFNHFLINFIVVYYTVTDLLLCYNDFNNLNMYSTNMIPVELTFSVHFYHIIIYFRRFLFDDWLHHIIMIFFTLPFGVYYDAGPIMSHCLFFISGLPGGINYLFLFLQRNSKITKKLQKKVNYFLNLWIRNPGCIASSVIIYLYHCTFIYNNSNFIYTYMSFYILLSCYWNGIYFMEQVVRNYNLLYPTV